MKDVTFIIKTFERPQCLEKLLTSLRAFYPDSPVLVADDGQNASDATLSDGTKVFAIPYDSGLSAGRNFLLTKVETKYFCLLDDDFVFTSDTDIAHLRKMAGQHRLDVAAGAVRDGGVVHHYEGHFRHSGDVLKYVRGANEKNKLEIVFNFFVGKTEKFLEIGAWDEDLKLAEHTDFFFRNRDKLKIGYFAEVIVDHERVRTPEYQVFRKRGQKYFQIFMRKQGLKKVIGFDGKITDLHGPDTPKPKELNPFTICITHFERKDSLKNLVLSIAKYYPEAQIIIGDTSRHFDTGFYATLWSEAERAGLQEKGVAWRMPFDAGLSFMRNELATKAKSPFLLYLEDDFEWTEATDPHVLLAPFHSPNIAVVGGSVRERGGIVNFHGRLVRRGNDLFLENSDEPNFVLNFIMVRKKALIDVMWDPELKLAEHTDFFLRLSETRWRVAYEPKSEIFHHRDRDPHYNKYRSRFHDYLVKFFDKHSLHKYWQFGKVMEMTRMHKIKTYRPIAK